MQSSFFKSSETLEEETATSAVDSILAHKLREQCQSIKATYEDRVLRIFATYSPNTANTTFYRAYGALKAPYQRPLDFLILGQRFLLAIESKYYSEYSGSNVYEQYLRTWVRAMEKQFAVPMYFAVGKEKVATTGEFEKARHYVATNRDKIEAEYDGNYIAVWDDAVVDVDPDFSCLAQRVYERLGYVAVYMPLITKRPITKRIPSPRIRRPSKGE